MARSLQYGRTRLGLALLGFIVLLALVGPFVAPHAPDAVAGLPAQSPSGQFLLGTDYLVARRARPDATPTPPPTPSWYQGRESIGTYLLQPSPCQFTAANLEPALAGAPGHFRLWSRCSLWTIRTSAP